MKTIHQYQIAFDQQDVVLKLKAGFKVVHSEFSVIDRAVNLWVEEALSIDIDSAEVRFRLAPSGAPLPKHYAHVTTAFDAYTRQAYHLFINQQGASALTPPDQSNAKHQDHPGAHPKLTHRAA